MKVSCACIMAASAAVSTNLLQASAFAPACVRLKAVLACSPLDAFEPSVYVQIQARDLKPALAWVDEHRLELFEASPFSAEDFEFRLHRLQFVQLLTTKGDS